MIYIVRHGQTDWNKIGKNQGQTDIPLNEVGISQAYEVKEKLKDIKFDIVFSSPLKRAFETAKIIAGNNVIVDDRLIERGNGLLEGKTKDEMIEIIEKEKIDMTDIDNDKFGIESIRHLQERVDNFLNEITSKYKDKNILIVTHAGAIINMVQYFEHSSEHRVLKNCEVLKYEN